MRAISLLLLIVIALAAAQDKKTPSMSSSGLKISSNDPVISKILTSAIQKFNVVVTRAIAQIVSLSTDTVPVSKPSKRLRRRERFDRSPDKHNAGSQHLTKRQLGSLFSKSGAFIAKYGTKGVALARQKIGLLSEFSKNLARKVFKGQSLPNKGAAASLATKGAAGSSDEAVTAARLASGISTSKGASNVAGEGVEAISKKIPAAKSHVTPATAANVHVPLKAASPGTQGIVGGSAGLSTNAAREATEKTAEAAVTKPWYHLSALDYAGFGATIASSGYSMASKSKEAATTKDAAQMMLQSNPSVSKEEEIYGFVAKVTGERQAELFLEESKSITGFINKEMGKNGLCPVGFKKDLVHKISGVFEEDFTKYVADRIIIGLGFLHVVVEKAQSKAIEAAIKLNLKEAATYASSKIVQNVCA